MYADHHVGEVRRILFEVPGVREVYASSAFGVVEVDFDAEQTSEKTLETCLAEAGYLSELPVPTEASEPAIDRAADGGFPRNTASDASSGSTIAFRQVLNAEPSPQTPSKEAPKETHGD
jgi:copper chaperone CopZ